MSKIIEVKEEFRGLQFDLEHAQRAGKDPEWILFMVTNKINNIMKMDTKNYFTLVWKN